MRSLLEHSEVLQQAQELALRSNQVTHRLYVSRIAGEGQAAELPAALDGSQHRVVVIGHVGGARGVIRVRDGQCDDVSAALSGH